MNTLFEWGTISFASILGMLFSFFIALVLPIVLLILIRKKTKANITSFLVGCAVFVVFALVLEQILHSAVFALTGPALTENLLLYALYGGLAAALFEETGRWLGMKYLMKDSLSKPNAFMYGIGHGGIEAILLVGITYGNNLLYSILINLNLIEASLSSLDEELQQITFLQLQPLWELPSWQFYMAGAERLFALTLQIVFSVFVYHALVSGHRKFWFLAFIAHFAVDFLVVVISGYGAPVWLVELILLIMVLLLAGLAYKLCQKKETTNEEA